MSFNYYYIRSDDFPAHAGGGEGTEITRANYEVYFVMYVDNELSAADRKAVERFVEQNPDLEEELVMLQQSVLRADEHIVFEQKELLFKDVAAMQINEQNYEEYFVLYGDDELTNEEKDKVERFVYKHPQYQAEFELIQQVKLVPDNTLTFPDKTYLYRTEEDDSKVIAFPWWRLSAAAIAILVIGSLAWYISTQNGPTEEVAGVTEQQNTGKKTPPQQVQPDNTATNSTTANKDIAIVEKPVSDNPKAGIDQPDKTTAPSNRKKNISTGSNIQQPSYVQHKSNQQPVQDPDNNDIAYKAKPVNVVLDNTNEQPVVKSGIIKRTINEPLAINTVAEKPEDETDKSPTYVLNTSIKKTPLRGLFRKVSRVVDKVTSTDENGHGGVRIANLEFALK
jgi:hypothetical protein